MRELDCPRIVTDNRGAAFDVTDYVLSLGHRRIAYIGGPAGLYASEDRLGGFREAPAAPVHRLKLSPHPGVAHASVSVRGGVRRGSSAALREALAHQREQLGRRRLAWVPSTWSSTSSSRFTRTHQEEFSWATMPSSSSNSAYAASSALAG